eukprot:15447493-Alexandrium_andersonii.AAC.2
MDSRTRGLNGLSDETRHSRSKQTNTGAWKSADGSAETMMQVSPRKEESRMLPPFSAEDIHPPQRHEREIPHRPVFDTALSLLKAREWDVPASSTAQGRARQPVCVCACVCVRACVYVCVRAGGWVSAWVSDRASEERVSAMQQIFTE